jgi:7-cyano-7-deazaguanine synthase in queuosine biosynthesis
MNLTTVTTATGKSVLHYSGGLDSYIISKLESFDTLLYINSKSKYAETEIEFLKKQGLPVVIDSRLDLEDLEMDSAMVPLRNLFFVMIASYYGDRIVLGATAGDRSTDKDYTFAEKTSDLLSYIYQKSWWCEGRELKVDLTYKNYTKKDLLDAYIKSGFSLEDLRNKSFSCYHPVSEDSKQLPCGTCKPCVRKWITFLQYDIDISEDFAGDPRTVITEEYVETLKSNLHTKLSRGKEDEEIIDIYERKIKK